MRTAINEKVMPRKQSMQIQRMELEQRTNAGRTGSLENGNRWMLEFPKDRKD
jgi:hypothetical protein